MMSDTNPLSLPERRAFLMASASVGGGLLLTMALPVLSRQPAPAPALAATTFSPNAFIRIDAQGTVSLIMAMVEMGQGIYTALSMLIAEELEIDLDQVRLEPAPPGKAFINSIIHEQITADSSSIRAFAQIMREAGATARTMLVAAAAAKWRVDVASCKAEHGVVVHTSSGRKLGYGALASSAALLPVPAKVSLKSPGEFKLIGKPAKRLDTPDKVNGKALYGIDVVVPGMKVAAVAICPVLGGTVAGYDEAKARAINGVHQVVKLDNAIAVIADHTGAAKKGVAALDPRWNVGPNGNIDSAEVLRQLQEALKKPGVSARNDADVDSVLAGAAQRLEATYEQPFVAHAPMEPMNCTVHVRKDRCDVWLGSQAPARAQAVAAKLTGLPLEAVTVHGYYLGGGFGRKSEIDYVTQAVQIAMQVDAPVKLIWTREQDTRHDYLRPYYLDHIAAGLDAQGHPVAWTHRIAGSSFMARIYPTMITNGFDPDAIDGAANLAYALPKMRVEFVRQEPGAVLTTWWRSIGPGRNAFVVESFMDELAAAAKRDPVEYRTALLGNSPRLLAVLKLAADKAGWGKPLPAGQGRGIAVQAAFESFIAQVAEVEVAPDGTIKVHRVVCAVDCGLTINPDTVEAQIQSGVIYGLSAALYGSISLKDGRVEQGNFDTFRVVRMDEAPAIEVHLVKSAEASGGVGELGTPCIMPAVANAIFAATGKRIRKLPMRV
jgi:isoquinoline 1-oxidoreductase beta subunit